MTGPITRHRDIESPPFASALQRSAAPTSEIAAAAINRAARRFGTRGGLELALIALRRRAPE